MTWIWVCNCGARLNVGEEGQALDRVRDHISSPGSHSVHSIERGRSYVLRWGDPNLGLPTKRWDRT